MLTPEQVKQYRQQYNIGASKRTLSASSTPSERIAKLRKVASGNEETKPVETVEPEVAETPKEEGQEEGLFGSPLKALKEFGSGVVESFKERSDAGAEEGARAIQGEISPVSATLRMLGQGAGAVGDIGFEALKLLTPQGIEKPIGEAVEYVAESAPAQAVMKTYEGVKEKYPEAMKNIEAVTNIASLLPVGKIATAVPNVISKTAKVATKLDDVVDARRAANKMKVKETVGKVVQAPTEEGRKVASRALADIDTEGVKTYKELNERIGEKVSALGDELDTYLEKTPEKLPKETLVTKTKVGDKIVAQNFVEDALAQLDELYTKIGDEPSAVAIRSVRDRLNTEGLTRQNVNDLARVYGQEFSQKAFSKQTGEALTSINAQMFENTRKGIKKAFRDTLSDDTAKVLDEKMSDLFRTKEMTDKLEQRVMKLQQAVEKRGVLEKGARVAGRAIDALTGHTLRGFFTSLIPGNVGMKTLNALDIQDQLASNLKKLDSVLSTANDDDFITKLLDMVDKSVKNPSAGLSVKSVVDPKQIAQNMDAQDFVRLEMYSEMLDSGVKISPKLGMKMDELLESMGVDTLRRKGTKELLHDILAEKEKLSTKVPVTSIE